MIGGLLVLGLRPLVLALGHDAGRDVRQADGRVGLVDVLAAGARGAERVHPDLVPVELDLDVALDLGQDLDEGERRVAALLRVERADPHQAVDAALGLELAVGARPSTPTVTLLMPVSSPSVWSRISVAKRWRSAQRRYIRSSISAQSVASVPPAPALIVRRALRWSYSPPNSRSRALALVLAASGRRLVVDARPRGSGRLLLGEVEQLEAVGWARDSRPRHSVELLAQALGLAQHLLARLADRPRTRARRRARRARPDGVPWSRGQRRPEVAWIRSTRSRISAGSTTSGLGGPGAGSGGARSGAGRSCSGRRRGSRRGSSVVGADAAVAVAIEGAA